MHKLDVALTWVENVLAASALALATVVAIVAVVLRFFFGTFLFWSEETIIYLIIYSTFLGAVITLRHNEHVNVDIIAVFLKSGGKRAVGVLGALVTVVYFGVIGFYAWLLIFEPFSTSTTTPSLEVPLWVVELAVPIGFSLMFLRAVEILVRTARGETAFKEGQASVLESEAAAIGLDMNRDALMDEARPPAEPRKRRSRKDRSSPDGPPPDGPPPDRPDGPGHDDPREEDR